MDYNDGVNTDVKAECEILGSILLSHNQLIQIISDNKLSASDFSLKTHEWIFNAMLEVYKAGEAMDVESVSNVLLEQGSLEAVGGSKALKELKDNSFILSPLNCPKLVERVAYYANKRKLSELCLETKLNLDNPSHPMKKSLEKIEKTVSNIRAKESKSISTNTSESAGLLLEQILDKSIPKTAIMTGIPTFDAYTGGLKPSKMYIVAASPGLGKSSIALDFMVEASKQSKYPAMLFSIEMSQESVLTRLLARQTDISVNKIEGDQLNKIEEKQLREATKQVEDFNIVINDSSSLSTDAMKAEAERQHLKYGGLSMIVIDYIQLIKQSNKSESIYQHITQCAFACAQMAKEIDVPVIVLSQLNRSSAGRTEKKPILSDLKESGALEQAAHTVAMLYREDEKDRNKAICVLAKNRSGQMGDIKLNFYGSRFMFSDASVPDPRIHNFVSGRREEEIF